MQKIIWSEPSLKKDKYSFQKGDTVFMMGLKESPLQWALSGEPTDSSKKKFCS